MTRRERFDAWKRRPGRPTLVALLEVTQGRVLAICRDVLRHREEAEEAAQETLLKIVEGIDQVSDAEHFERWVGLVATRSAIDRRRMLKRRRVRDLAGAALSSDSSRPVDGIQDALARLPDEDRDLIVERYFERRTLEEMARRRGVSDVAVRKRIKKAHGRLKRLLGSAFALGVGIMKAKAAVATLMVSLLLGGTWLVVSNRFRRPEIQAQRVTRQDVSPVVEDESPSLSAGSLGSAENTAATGDVALHNARRVAFIQKLERYRSMCKRLEEYHQSPVWESGGDTTELTHEINRLEKSMPALCGELQKEAPEFPEETLAFFLETDWNSGKSVIGRFLLPTIEDELESHGGRPGPILTALLRLADGDAKDRRFLVGLSEDLKMGSRNLASVCLGLLEDPDPEMRYAALAAFARQGRRGNLGEFFAEHKSRFQALALTGTKDRPAVFAFLALSAIGDKDTDEFILQQFESSASLPESWSRAAAMAKVAPRILPAQETRVFESLMRELNGPYNDLSYVHWITVALYLTPQRSVEVLRYAAERVPVNEEVLVEGLQGLVRCVEAGLTQAALQEIERLRRDGAVSQWAITGAARKVAPLSK